MMELVSCFAAELPRIGVDDGECTDSSGLEKNSSTQWKWKMRRHQINLGRFGTKEAGKGSRSVLGPDRSATREDSDDAGGEAAKNRKKRPFHTQELGRSQLGE